MKELSKSIFRRQRDPNFLTRYFIGDGIDIGGFPDPLTLYSEFFPLIETIKVWDLEDGDAEFMHSVPDETFNFVVSSHCLEHLNDPFVGLKNWFRIIKPGGHLVITIPEEDLYEQGTWPSDKNLDHKWSFTIWKELSWAPKSINVLTLIQSLGQYADIRSIKVEDSGYRYQLSDFDQTLTPTSESAIEFVIRKKLLRDVELKRNRNSDGANVQQSLLPYFNQYRDDMAGMKKLNAAGGKPFSNNNPL